MGLQQTIRLAAPGDVEAIRALVVANDMFPGEMLDEMIAPFFSGAEELWFVAGEVVDGVAYAAPEKLTNGTWNQLMIAVAPEAQGRGIGKALMRHLENELASKAMRMIVVDTSGAPSFEPTRGFYRAIGYEQVACIPDFWDAGDDKITFRRLITG